jgi:GTPase SAR1 family protein
MQTRISVEDLARKLKPILGSKVDELYFRYINSEDSDEKNEIFQILSSFYQKYLSKLLDRNFSLEPPADGTLSGEYPLAKVNYAEKELFDFSLRENDWPRHVCITGMSGSGKTTLALGILKNFVSRKKPFMVFDWKKSFRPLIEVNPSVMCFTVGNSQVSNFFKTNINRPPKGVSPREWINALCDLLAESFNVSFGVHKILLETLDEIFEGWGVYQGSELYPNWEHVKKMLEIKARDSKGRETGWYESALRIATVLTFGDFGKVINYDGKKSISIEDLFDKEVIFELNSLSNIEKKFFCEYLLTYIFKLKKAGDEKSDGSFKNAILVDEAHNIFLKKETSFMTESVTDMIYREMREYGTSLICLDQHISKLSDTVVGNSACHIAFQQQLPQDVEEVSSLMRLRDKAEIFNDLKVGSAIVKLSERYTSPFMINVPFDSLRISSLPSSKIKSKMEFVASVAEVEKNDSEFKEKIIFDEEPKPETAEKPVLMTEKTKKEEVIIGDSFSEVQNVLYNFALKKISEGSSFSEVEKLLDSGAYFGRYTRRDVLLVMNKLFAEKLETRKTVPGIFSDKKIIEGIGLSTEEKSLIEFLKANPSHDLATVELYRHVGLSSRKGNIIKGKLLEKGMITQNEERNSKGWRKLIRLS